MTLKQLEARGWTFHDSYCEKIFLGGIMVVPFDSGDSTSKVARNVTQVENAMQELTENADKFKQLKGLLS